jgi:anti-anti-sigma regulatory factor/HAMP domain-containing protein
MSAITTPRPASPMLRSFGDLSLQAKLLALILTLIVALMAITIGTSLSTLQRFEEHVSNTRLDQELTLLAARFRAEQEELKTLALAMTLDSELQAAVRAGDRPAVQRQALQLEVRHQLDQVMIVDAAGQALFGDLQQSDAMRAALELALQTIEQTSIQARPEGAMLTAVVPIKDSAGVQGALLIGQRMDGAFLQHVNSNRSDPILRLHTAPGAIPVSSAVNEADLPGDPISQDQSQLLQRNEPVAMSQTTASGASYRVLYAPISPGQASSLVYSIAVSTAEIEALRASMIVQISVVLAAVGLTALGLLFLVVRRLITRPLARLSRAAEQLGAGNLQVELRATGRDEIGRLTESFRAMVRQLRQSFSALEERNSLLQHEITERKRSEEAQARLLEEVTVAQATILEMATPLIPIDAETVVMPLVGVMDTQRAEQILTTLLEGVAGSRARVAILDITGVPVVDTQVAAILLRATRSVRLLGARVVLSGIRPEVAQSIVGLGVDVEGLTTYGSLEQAILATRKR